MRQPAQRLVDRPIVLLTGFGPFPSVAENVTAQLVPDLGRRAQKAFPSHTFITGILPTEWQAGPDTLLTLIARVKPALVLHFGVTRDAQGFRLEQQARNACQFKGDALGAHPPAPGLAAEGADCHPVTIPTRDIVNRLHNLGLPAHLSGDAGGYLCNAVLYHSLAAAAQDCRKTGFIHIPVDLSGPPLMYPDAVRGGLEIIRVCLGPDCAGES